MTTRLRPFFSFYGSKWRAASRYPSPVYDTIIEPFAGSAGYSLNHPYHAVCLYDVDPIIARVWDYLIHVSEREIRRLPIEVDQLSDLMDEQRWLIGFWLNKGSAQPCRMPGAWMRSGLHGKTQFWGEAIRERIASQVNAIRHWTVTEASYESIPNESATWFVDPPYSDAAGRRYHYSEVDYDSLGTWCQERAGQVMVCEHEGATWLPFESAGSFQSTAGRGRTGTSKEAIWVAA